MIGLVTLSHLHLSKVRENYFGGTRKSEPACGLLIRGVTIHIPCDLIRF